MRSAQRPADDQALFRFIWHDEADDRDDLPRDDLDDDDLAVAPLRARVLTRPRLRTMTTVLTAPQRRGFPHGRTARGV